jgi:uncharacterized protein (UPF0210 family)
MTDQTRRDFLGTLGAAALVPPLLATPLGGMLGAREVPASAPTDAPTRGFPVRTITAFVALDRLSDRAPLERALARLARAKRRFEAEGYEVQTTRIVLPPLVAALDARQRGGALADLRGIDALCAGLQAICGLGPVLMADRRDDDLASWAADLVRSTKTISFSAIIASPLGGIHEHGIRVAAEVTRAVAGALPTGMGSFQFAAAANVPAGTPFFPVGWHSGPDALAVGLESPSLVRDAFTGARDREDARSRLAANFARELREIERIASAVARTEAVGYGGIDSSPAPLGDDSIGGAIEALTGAPFGEAGTLQACALITDVIKRIPVKLCGYSGLMLPVLEDKVLAQRAREGHYGLRELLLFSSVCGTGLDVAPIPGDTPQSTIERILMDVAAQSVKLNKALSVRLFLVPGKSVGDPVHFEDPRLFDTVVLRA